MTRTARIVAWFAIVGSVTSIAAPPASAGASYPKVLRPSRGVYLGTFVKPRGGESAEQAIRRVERKVGRRFRVDHRYFKWDSSFPNSYDRWTWKHHRIVYANWNARTKGGAITSWSSIADGRWDSLIRRRADAIKSWGRPMYLTFHHEPENDGAFGSPSEYVAAFRRIVSIFRAKNVDNIAFAWTLMGSSFIDGTASRWYPGNRYVDFVACDSYNWYPGRSGARWRSFGAGVRSTVSFAAARRKPVIVAEYGVQEDPAVGGRKGRWFGRALAWLRNHSRVKAVLYFDSPTIYPWVTDSSRSSMRGYRRLASAGWTNP
jgi:beta-mannanase